MSFQSTVLRFVVISENRIVKLISSDDCVKAKYKHEYAHEYQQKDNSLEIKIINTKSAILNLHSLIILWHFGPCNVSLFFIEELILFLRTNTPSHMHLAFFFGAKF